MSFAHLNALIKSTSFRLALVIFLSVSLFSFILLLVVRILVEEAITKDAILQVDEWASEILSESESSDLYHLELYPVFKSVKPYELEHLHFPTKHFFRKYIDFLKQKLKDDNISSAEKSTINARLHILGEVVSFNPAEVPSALVFYFLDSEFPESLHNMMGAIIESKLNKWPAYTGEVKHSPSQRIEFYMENDEVLDTEKICVHLSFPNQTKSVSNINATADGLSYFSPHFLLTTSSKNNDIIISKTNPVCIVQRIPLADGGLFHIGMEFESEYHLLSKIDTVLFNGFIFSLLAALALSFWLSRKSINRISRINDLCDEVKKGKLDKRIPVENNSDDYNRLAVNINSMLDQIQELMQSVKQVSDNIAHDLKSPLSRLHGQLELLLHMDKPEKQTIEAIIAENEFIIQCFNGLLRISQIEKGARRNAFHNFSFKDAVETIIDVYEPSIAEKDIQLSTHLTPENSDAFGDKDQWLQAISNLFDNAIKYTPTSGSLFVSLTTIYLTPSKKALEFIVHDNGPGIPKQDLSRVFQRFYRLEAHRSTKGHGLGLSLVKAVCDIHEAEIKLDNQNGLMARIVIPLPS